MRNVVSKRCLWRVSVCYTGSVVVAAFETTTNATKMLKVMWCIIIFVVVLCCDEIEMRKKRK